MRSDWHPEDLKAAVRKGGHTLSSLGRLHGLSRGTMANALVLPYAAAEQVIADFLGVPAHDIWPSRYNSNGTRKRPQPGANYTRRRRLHRIEEARA